MHLRLISVKHTISWVARKECLRRCMYRYKMQPRRRTTKPRACLNISRYPNPAAAAVEFVSVCLFFVYIILLRCRSNPFQFLGCRRCCGSSDCSQYAMESSETVASARCDRDGGGMILQVLHETDARTRGRCVLTMLGLRNE